MTIEQLGRLIQAVTPELVKVGNALAHGEKSPRQLGVEEMEELANDLERIAHELYAYCDPSFTHTKTASR